MGDAEVEEGAEGGEPSRIGELVVGELEGVQLGELADGEREGREAVVLCEHERR